MTKEYKEGWKAKTEDARLRNCPYERGTVEAKRWCAGWYAANEDPTRLSENSAMFSDSHYY